jgi:hypothetical protein
MEGWILVVLIVRARGARGGPRGIDVRTHNWYARSHARVYRPFWADRSFQRVYRARTAVLNLIHHERSGFISCRSIGRYDMLALGDRTHRVPTSKLMRLESPIQNHHKIDT